MAKLTGIAAGAFLALALTGCSRVGATVNTQEPHATNPASSPSPTESPLVFEGAVRLETVAGQPMLVTGTNIYRVEGSRLLAVGTGPDNARLRSDIVALTDGRLAMATSDGTTATLYASGDGGLTWRVAGSIAFESPTGVARLDVAADGNTVAIVAEEASGSGFRFALASVSTDGGTTWKTSRAPTGGSLEFVAGAFWLVGGVNGDAVFRSVDMVDWEAIEIPIDQPYWTADSVQAVAGLGIVIPITTHPIAAQSDILFMSTLDNGRTWNTAETLAAPPTEFSTSIPSVVGSDGIWTVVYVDGSKIISGRFDDSSNTVRSPNGLPIGVLDVEGAGTKLVALTMPSSCPEGKASCSSMVQLVASSDGGQTWTLLQ